MDRKYIRRRIKADTWQLLPGNWLRIFALILLLSVVTSMIATLLPIRVPTGEELIAAEKRLDEALAASTPRNEWEEPSEQEISDVENAMKHYCNLYIPRGMSTERMIALFVITMLLLVLITVPYKIGLCKFFLQVAQGKKPKFREAFSVFANLKMVFSSIWLWLLVFFISTFWAAVFMTIPIAVMVAGMVMNIEVLAILGMVLLPVALVFTFLWNSRYEFASYIFAEGEKGAFASLRECVELMRGRKAECMALRFSYLLWDALSVSVTPLAFIYVAVYNTTYARYLSYLRGRAGVSDETPHTQV